MNVKIFGREPAAFVGVIEGALSLIVTLHFFHLTSQTEALTMAVVTSVFGLYTAYVTHDTLLGAAIGFIKAILALGVGYGLHVSPETTGAIIALITVVFGLINRASTTPLANPSFGTGVRVGGAHLAVADGGPPNQVGEVTLGLLGLVLIVVGVILLLVDVFSKTYHVATWIWIAFIVVGLFVAVLDYSRGRRVL